jgi:hypothetical protein
LRCFHEYIIKSLVEVVAGADAGIDVDVGIIDINVVTAKAINYRVERRAWVFGVDRD